MDQLENIIKNAKGYSKKGQLANAISAYRNAIKINPVSAGYYYELAKILVNIGQHDEADTCFLKAISLRSDCFAYYKEYGDYLTRNRRWEEAVVYYLKAIQFKKKEDKLDFGSFLFQNFSKEQAEKLICSFQQIIELDPNCSVAYKILGNLLSMTGRVKEAISYYQIGYYKKLAYYNGNSEFLKKYPLKEQERAGWNKLKSQGPNFIIIGPWKCATSSLYRYVAKHPLTVPPYVKEIHFFNQNFHYGIDWYLAHFPFIPEKELFVTGEATPSYFSNKKSPELIYESFPNVKLITILRNPADRAISEYNMQLRYSLTKGTMMDNIKPVINKLKSTHLKDDDDVNLASTGVIGGSLYIYHIKRWLNLFPKDQLLVLKTEDLSTEPKQVMERVYDFLELPHYRRDNYRSVNKGIYNPAEKEVRGILAEFFQPFNHKLEDYLDMQFKWD